MACNCKVNQQIDYLHKKYGHNIPVSKTKKVSFTAKEIFKTVSSGLLVLLLIPFMLLHVAYVSIFKKDKTVNMGKLTGLAKASK